MLESHQLQTTLKPAFQEDFSILLIPKHLHMVLDHREVYFEASFNPHLLKIKLNTLLIREAPFSFPSCLHHQSIIPLPHPLPPLTSLPFPQSTQRMLPKLPGGGSADNQSWAGHLLLPLLFLITATLLGGSR